MKPLLVFFIFSMLILPVYSEDQTKTTALTLDECITLAIKNNASLKASEMNTLASEEELNATRNLQLPTFKIRSDYTLRDQPDLFTINQNSILPGVPPQDSQVSARNQSFYDVSFDVEKRLFADDFSHTFSRAQDLALEAHFESERRKRLLVYTVKKVYLEAVKDQMGEEILTHILEAKNERLRVLAELQKGGYVTQSATSTMEAEVGSAQLAIDKEKDKKELAISRLQKLTSYPEPMALIPTPENVSLIIPIDQIRNAALKSREELKVFLAKTKAAKEDVEIAKTEKIPDVSLLGRYINQSKTGITRPQVWLLGAKLEWAPFDWGKTDSQIRSKEALVEKTTYEQKELADTILLEAEEARQAVKEKEEESDVDEKVLRASLYSFNELAQKYAQGENKPVDLLEAWAHLVEAYNLYMTGITNLDLAVAELELATSTPITPGLRKKEIYNPNLDSLLKVVKGLISNQSLGRPAKVAVKLAAKPTRLAVKHALKTAHLAKQLAVKLAKRRLSASSPEVIHLTEVRKPNHLAKKLAIKQAKHPASTAPRRAANSKVKPPVNTSSHKVARLQAKHLGNTDSDGVIHLIVVDAHPVHPRHEQGILHITYEKQSLR